MPKKENCGICCHFKNHICTNSESPYNNEYMIDIDVCNEYSLEDES